MKSSTIQLQDLSGSKNDIFAAAISGITPPPQLTTSEWADEHRFLPAGGPFPGRWRTSTMPYQKEPMDVATDKSVKIFVLMWGSQLGKTETLLNILGRHIHIDPANMMFVMPSLDMVEGFSDERVQPMIDLSPELKKVATDLTSDEPNQKKKTNQKKKKTFQGGFLVFAGSNSAATLSSRAIRIFLADEIDKFKLNIGKDGDPMLQAIQRTTQYWNAVVCLTSTPTIKNESPVEGWFNKSQRFYYHIDCPECGHAHFTHFFPQDDEKGQPRGGVTWPDGQPEKAVYSCPECGSIISQKQIYNAVDKGRWVTSDPPNAEGIVGYHINSLCSRAPANTIPKLAQLWESVLGDPLKEQTFWNLKLGLPYDPTKEAQSTPQQLFNRKEDYGPDNIPKDVVMITAGVDIQSNRGEIQWVGWGIGDEIWILDHVAIPGDPTDHRLFDRIDEALARTFEHPSGKTLELEAAAIDSGYSTNQVTQFVNEARTSFKPYYAIKGIAGQGRVLWELSPEKLKQGEKLWRVGADTGKAEIYGALAKTEPAPGYIHFPKHLEMAFFEQLLSNKIKIDFTSFGTKQRWILPSGKQDEALDCLNYARACRFGQPVDLEARAVALWQPDEKDEELADLAW